MAGKTAPAAISLANSTARSHGAGGVQLEVRTGVDAGEVVLGKAPGGAPTTLGDTVNVAQQLETSAPPNEVLIGEEPRGCSRPPSSSIVWIR